MTLQIKAVAKDLGSDLLNTVQYWRHNIRGNSIPKKYFSGKSKHPPVILLQGFLGTRSVLQPLEKFLREQGRDVISLDLGLFNLGDIRKSSQLLGYKIERIIDRFGDDISLEKVDIIGHSMGGLIGLHYVKRLGGHRLVRKLITLGAPFSGTWASYIGLLPFGMISKGIWQMMPGSPFLKSLQSHPDEIHQTEVISIAAKYDTVCPPNSCLLPGAVNLNIPVGHAGLLVDQRVFETVIQILAPNSAKLRLLSTEKR